MWRVPRFRLSNLLFLVCFHFSILIICVLLCSLCSSHPVWAQVPTSPSTPPSRVSEVEKKKEVAGKLWFAHRQLLQEGKWEASARELEKLYQWKLDQGIRNHYLYAVALIRESQQIALKGKPEAISSLLSYAEKMAPDFAQVAYARAHWLWSQSPLSLANATQAAREGLHGVFLSFHNLEEAIPLYVNLSFWILSSVILTIVIFSFSLVFKYHALYTHHLKHLIRLQVPPKALQVLAYLLLLLPFLLGLGWLGGFTLWLLVFWIYGGRRDRGVITALLLILLLLPTGIRFHASFLASLTGNGVIEIVRANNGTWSPDLHRELLTLYRINPRDPEVLQALGLVEKRMGSFLEAEQHFREWIGLEPNSSAAFNNLGNVYLATNRVDWAVEAYQKAIQLEPSRAEAHYNLGQAYLHKFLLNEAEAKFRQAKELQPRLISFYTEISSQNPNRMVIDWTIGPSRLWGCVFANTANREKIARGFWEFLWEGVPLTYGEAAVVSLFVLLGLIHMATKEKPLIRSCERCGRLICSKCIRSMVIGNQCSQCISAFTTRKPADPQGVMQKRTEVVQYQDRQRSFQKWLSLIVPGSGHLLHGRPGEGIVYLFIFVLFLTKIFLWRGWVSSLLFLDISLSLPWRVVAAILFLFYYGFVQHRMKRFHLKRG